MALNFKKALLTGSAIVAAATFAANNASAAALTFTAATNTNATATNDTWDVSTQTGFTNSSLTWNGAGAVGVTASGTGTANVGGLTVTSVAGANTFAIGNNTLASTLIVNGNIAGDVASNDLAISVNATGNTSSSTLNLKGTTMTLGTGTGITLDSGTGGGIASVLFTGTGAQGYTGDIRGAVAGDGVLTVTNTGGTVTFNNNIGSTALGHIGTGGATGTTTTVFVGTVTVANTSGSTGGDGKIVLGQTDGGSSATTFKGAVAATSLNLGVAGAGNDTNTVTFDASGASFTVTPAVTGATANDINNLVFLGGASKVVTLTGGGTNIDNISMNQTSTALTLSASLTSTGSLTFDAQGTVNVNGGTLTAGTIDMKNTASTVAVANGASVTSNVTSTGGANGAVSFAGASTLTGNIGSSAATGLSTLAFNNTGANAVAITGNAYATAINVTGTGTSTIQGTTNGAVAISAAGALVSRGTLTGSTAFTADGSLTVGNSGGVGAGIVGNVGTNVANTGTLAFAGTGTNTVSGTVGATNALKSVSIGAGSVTFQNATFAAQSLTFTGTGTADITAAGTGVNAQAINFAGLNGTAVLGAGVNYSGAATTTSTGTGNLTVGSGSTISGTTIGTGGNKLNTVSFTGGANTVSSIVHATKADIGNATVNVTNTTFDSGVNFSNNTGQITFASASTVTGNITATSAGDGTIVYTGPLTINGDVARTKALTVAGTLTINGNAVAADATDVGIQNVNVSGTYATTANTTLTYRVNTPTTSGKITSIGNATVDANTAVSMVVDTSVFVANGQQFVLVDGNNAGTGIATLSAGKLTTTSTTLLKFKQDTTNTHDLVVIADRTASSTIATNPSNAAVGTVLDSLGGSSNPQVNALNVALGAATTSTQVDNLLSSVVAPTNTSTAAVSSSAASIANVVTAQIDIGSSGTISMPSFGGGDKSGKSGGNEAMGRNVWFQGFGASADQGVRNGAAGYDVGSYGAVAGADKEINDNLRLGINVAYAKTNVNGRDINRTGTDVDSYQGGLYGAYDFGSGYFATGQASYMYNDMDTVRYNVGGVPGQNARANPHSSMYSARTEAGRVIAVPHGFTLTPSALANFSYTDMAKYSETGAGGLSLSNVNPDDPRMVELGLRMRAEALINDNHGGMIKPALSVGYRYDLVGDRSATVAGLVGGGTSFTTTGTKPARGTAEAGAGITWVSPYTVEFKAEYDYEHKSEYNSHSGFVRAGMKF